MARVTDDDKTLFLPCPIPDCDDDLRIDFSLDMKVDGNNIQVRLNPDLTPVELHLAGHEAVVPVVREHRALRPGELP